MGPGFNAVCVARERSTTTNQAHQATAEKEGRRRTERGRKGATGGGGRPRLSAEISSAQGLVLGLCIHPSIS